MATIYTEIELKEFKMKELRNILKNQYIMLEPVRTKAEAIQIILRLQNTEATPYFKWYTSREAPIYGGFFLWYNVIKEVDLWNIWSTSTPREYTK